MSSVDNNKVYPDYMLDNTRNATADGTYYKSLTDAKTPEERNKHIQAFWEKIAQPQAGPTINPDPVLGQGTIEPDPAGLRATEPDPVLGQFFPEPNPAAEQFVTEPDPAVGQFVADKTGNDKVNVDPRTEPEEQADKNAPSDSA